MLLQLDRLPSPIGTLLVVFDEAHCLRALDFEDCSARMHCLLARHYGAADLNAASAPAAIAQPIAAYLDGDFAGIGRLRVATNGSVFQRRVWSALRAIAPGTTTSYGALAARLGAPAANRAVGLANGANPIAIVVPCHRVIGAAGALTGYGGGLERKRWLLAHEGAVANQGAAAHERALAR